MNASAPIKTASVKRTMAGVPLFLLGFYLISCDPKAKVDVEEEGRVILALDSAARENHFSKNTKAFVESFSADFLSINKGTIARPSYKESFQRFDRYFKSVQFVAWDNQEPPVVRFSEDATVAYVAVDKLVVIEYEAEPGKMVSDTTRFAWLSVYKKEKNQWKLDALASTNK